MKRKQIAMIQLPDPMRVYAKVLTEFCIRSELYSPDPIFKQVRGSVRARRWDHVVKLAELAEEQQYSGVLDQYLKTQLVALVKKFPFSSSEVPGFNPEDTAWKKFLAAEHRCKRVNQRSAALRNGDGFRYAEYIRHMRGYIAGVLGVKPDYDAILDQCNFGPGASVGVSGDRTNFARKILAGKWTATRMSLSLATLALWKHEQYRHLILRQAGAVSPGGGTTVCYDYEAFATYVASRVELVTHNNINFVPKTFKTKRSIASEPLLNGFLQKGIDEYMRSCLRRRGLVDLDLRNQLPNQEMARSGSRGGFNPYATIDLSSASDSISTSIVRLLFPAEWFDLFDRTRSHWYRYKGKLHAYQKFVSMGNGFCFPLQTLLFASVCYAVAQVHRQPVDFRVYGDDIIVRQSLALVVLELLHYLGFRNNPDKTYVVGPFRESCGTDWYSGLDIRPVYVDFRLDTNVDLYKIHNATLRSDLTYGIFDTVREYLRSACPDRVRFVRPFHGNADAAFTVAKDEAMRSEFVSWDRNRWGWRWRELKTTPVRDILYGVDSQICSELEYLAVLRGSSPRSPLTVRRKSRVSVRAMRYWGLPGEIPWSGADSRPL